MAIIGADGKLQCPPGLEAARSRTQFKPGDERICVGASVAVRKGAAQAKKYPDGLTDKQRDFVRHYVENGRSEATSYRAIYGEHLSNSSAQPAGRKLLQREGARAMIAEADERERRATERVMANLEVTAERVLTEAAKLAFGDLRDLFDEEGRLKRPDELPEEVAARIAAIEVVARRVPGNRNKVEYVHKVKQWDKLGALTLLARHLGMLTDKVEHTGAIGITISQDDADL